MTKLKLTSCFLVAFGSTVAVGQTYTPRLNATDACIEDTLKNKFADRLNASHDVQVIAGDEYKAVVRQCEQDKKVEPSAYKQSAIATLNSDRTVSVKPYRLNPLVTK